MRGFPIDAQFGTPGGLVRTLDALVHLRTGESTQVEAVLGFLDSYSPDARQAMSRRGTRGRVSTG